MTKANKARLNNYNNATASALWQIYGRYSQQKANAFEYCKRLQYERHGYGLRVFNGNSFTFSAGFQYRDPETGKLMLMYITKDFDREIAID